MKGRHEIARVEFTITVSVTLGTGLHLIFVLTGAKDVHQIGRIKHAVDVRVARMGSQHIAYEEFEVAQIDLPISVEIELSLAVMNRAADGVNVKRISPTVAVHITIRRKKSIFATIFWVEY